jgi:hypothetical protein
MNTEPTEAEIKAALRDYIAALDEQKRMKGKGYGPKGRFSFFEWLVIFMAISFAEEANGMRSKK